MEKSHSLPINYLLSNRYTITKIIGQGGFGITYAAQDEKLDMKVCIKELFIAGNSTRGANLTVQSQSIADFSFSDFVKRFIEEARQLAKFNHPNIVRVIDVFQENQTAYMVMEFVEGETLKSKIEREGPMASEAAFSVMHQLLDAVEEVHRAGMLHRDIKPDNILITPKSKVVLIDFGSARAYTEGKTITHTAMLTPGYAPMEQYSQRAARGTFTDIYALGATLYFVLSGKKPMDATDRYHEKMPAPHELNPKVSTQLSSLIMLAMEMKAEDRFQTVEEFRAGISNVNAGKGDITIKVPVEKPIKKTEEKIQLPPKNKNNNTLILSLIGIAAIVMLLIFAVPWANSSGKEANTTEDKTGLNIEMIAVAGGTFTMGCTTEQGGDCTDYEKPAHQVTLSDYKIGKYEVTQAQWKAVMGNNPSNFSGCNKCPVENVSWNDIQDFISRLNAKTGKTYRLPTETEWEFAARGGNNSNKSKYSGSNILDEVAWYDGTSGSKTHEVGTKAANELGIHDMSGNVWEWCSDWYGDYDASSKTNPKGASGGSFRVLRGGSWYFNPQFCRVSNRNNRVPDNRISGSGFRLVLAP